jgi:excisionase family DNA binding protein
VLRLDRLLGDAEEGAVERFLATLDGARRLGTGWESVCPATPTHRGLQIRFEEGALIAWCTAGCPDQVALAALTERLRKRDDVKVSPREAPAAVPATAPMLGLTEAAQVLGCHRRTVRAYLRAGLFPGRLLAGRWKIRREDLDAFLEAAPRAGGGERTAPAARSAER